MKDNGADLCFSKPLPLLKLKKWVAQLLGLALFNNDSSEP